MLRKLRILCGVFLFFAVLVLILGCRSQKKTVNEVIKTWTYEEQDTVEAEITSDNTQTLIGVAMPTRTSERWLNDGANMKAKLEILGYAVELEYADDDIQMQVNQIRSMIENNVNCLVISAIDSTALLEVLEEAKEKDIPVIAYDRLLMETDAISYYATFDNKEVGKLIGQYIEETKNLSQVQKSGGSETIEFFMGSPDDNNAVYMYDGVMEVLGSYLEDGTLVCKSGRVAFDDTCILRWSEDTANDMCDSYLEQYYIDDSIDIICSVFDGFDYGIKRSLLEHGYSVGEDWPLITGQDAECSAVSNLIQGYQSMTIFKDSRELATQCVNLVQAVIEGVQPEINDNTQYNNGCLTVPSYLCIPEVITIQNYEEKLIQSSYYTQLQLTK